MPINIGRNEGPRRQSLRNRLTSSVKVVSFYYDEITTTVVDVSNGGVALTDKGWDVPPIGSVVSIQVQDLPIAAPFEDMVITRHDSGVVGLKFADTATGIH